MALVWFFVAPWSSSSGALVFVIAASLFYLIPFFRPRPLILQFCGLVLLGLFVPGGGVNALGLGFSFFLLFGIKDLEFVERDIAYEVLALAAIFMFAVNLYRTVPHWSAPSGLVGVALFAALFYIFLRRMPWQDPPREKEYSILPSLLGAFLVFEVGMVVLFLPIDFISQACVAFAASMYLGFIVSRKQAEDLPSGSASWAFGIFVLAAGLVLVLSTWKI